MKPLFQFAAIMMFCLSAGHSFAQESRQTEWRSDMTLHQIGIGNATQIYDNALDYLFPRRLLRPGQSSCHIVMRFEPASGVEHQLNLNLVRDREHPTVWTSSIWSFQLERRLSDYLSSELAAKDGFGQEAKRFVSVAKVTVKHIAVNQRLNELINSRLENGFVVALSDAIPVGHGDRYQLWAGCGLDDLQLKLMTPPDDALTKWMADIWIEATHSPN